MKRGLYKGLFLTIFNSIYFLLFKGFILHVYRIPILIQYVHGRQGMEKVNLWEKTTAARVFVHLLYMNYLSMLSMILSCGYLHRRATNVTFSLLFLFLFSFSPSPPNPCPSFGCGNIAKSFFLLVNQEAR